MSKGITPKFFTSICIRLYVTFGKVFPIKMLKNYDHIHLFYVNIPKGRKNSEYINDVINSTLQNNSLMVSFKRMLKLYDYITYFS